MIQTDAERLESEEMVRRYAKRQTAALAERYSCLNPSVYMSMQEKERALIAWLRDSWKKPPENTSLIEVGCGAGGNFYQLMRLGFRPGNLAGNELLHDRVDAARANVPPGLKLFPGDACALDLGSESFDIVFQSTVFTSILDAEVRRKLAAQMWRWVRPGGGILWYDFIFDNPSNPDVRKVAMSELRALFPGSLTFARRVTLAPPISRRVTRLHPQLYTVFNALPFLRTHYLCFIEKPLRHDA
jgi:SAM-dependent methyltransferase